MNRDISSLIYLHTVLRLDFTVFIWIPDSGSNWDEMFLKNDERGCNFLCSFILVFHSWYVSSFNYWISCQKLNSEWIIIIIQFMRNLFEYEWIQFIVYKASLWLNIFLPQIPKIKGNNFFLHFFPIRLEWRDEAL